MILLYSDCNAFAFVRFRFLMMMMMMMINMYFTVSQQPKVQ